jgi:signal transduction histidine kinase
MPDITAVLRRLATSWRGDLLLAAIMVVWTLAYLVATGEERRWTVLAVVLPYSAALAVRRRWPIAAAAVACVALLAVRPLGLDGTLEGLLAVPFLWTPFLIAYSVGVGAGIAVGVTAIALLTVTLQIENKVFNPLLVMITFGPWLVGRIVLSRRTMTEELQARNDELRAEHELFAQESVRYERARIARELHDIVAHCLSVMVVQASAGQRAGAADRDAVAEALESVAEAAVQAQAEIGRLVELLSGEARAGASPRLQMVDELVRRASLTGLAVSCRFEGSCDHLAPAASEAAYRVVQEALTNALKHAPGAPVDITVRGQDAEVSVDVVNAAPRQRPSGLEQSGGSFGLAGMRERVTACGGNLTSGPTPAGGWQVSILLPGSLNAGGVPANSGVSVLANNFLSGRMEQGPLHV